MTDAARARPQHAGDVTAPPGEPGEAIVALADLAAEELAHPGAAPAHGLADLAVGDLAEGLDLAPSGTELGQPAEVPGPRVHDVADAAAAPGDEAVDDLDDVEHDGLHDGADQTDRPVAAEDDAEAVARLQPSALVVAAAQGELVAMARGGLRGDDHPGTGDVRSPAEAHVVEEVADPLVEAADGDEQVGPHQRARTGDGEDVAHGVVLRLVELAALHERHAVAGVVHALADLEQAARVVPVDELGPDHGGVGPVGLLDEEAHGVGGEGDVVVAEEVEGGALHDLEHLVGGGAEPGVLVEAPDEGARRRDRPTRGLTSSALLASMTRRERFG